MKLLRFVWRWLQVSAATVAALAAVWLCAQYIFGLRLLAVQTNSMVPIFRSGDALVMQKTTLEQIHTGQIVSYQSPRNPRELITHRLAGIDRIHNRFQTKGDRLVTLDPPVRGTLLKGRIIRVMPGMGRALTWLHSWPALIMCVYVPAAVILAVELMKLERYYRRWLPYRLPGRQVV
jgi:signal peptidase I